MHKLHPIIIYALCVSYNGLPKRKKLKIKYISYKFIIITTFLKKQHIGPYCSILIGNIRFQSWDFGMIFKQNIFDKQTKFIEAGNICRSYKRRIRHIKALYNKDRRDILGSSTLTSSERKQVGGGGWAKNLLVIVYFVRADIGSAYIYTLYVY